MNVEILKESNQEVLSDVNNLLKQLVHDPATYAPISLETLQAIISDKNTFVVAAVDKQRVIGMGILYRIIKPRGYYGSIEDMMVDQAYRGQGIGEAIGRKLIETAREQGIKTIELSARPSRVAANSLYKKLGFEPKETNVYRLKL